MLHVDVDEAVVPEKKQNNTSLFVLFFSFLMIGGGKKICVFKLFYDQKKHYLQIENMVITLVKKKGNELKG